MSNINSNFMRYKWVLLSFKKIYKKFHFLVKWFGCSPYLSVLLPMVLTPPICEK